RGGRCAWPPLRHERLVLFAFDSSPELDIVDGPRWLQISQYVEGALGTRPCLVDRDFISDASWRIRGRRSRGFGAPTGWSGRHTGDRVRRRSGLGPGALATRGGGRARHA